MLDQLSSPGRDQGDERDQGPNHRLQAQDFGVQPGDSRRVEGRLFPLRAGYSGVTYFSLIFIYILKVQNVLTVLQKMTLFTRLVQIKRGLSVNLFLKEYRFLCTFCRGNFTYNLSCLKFVSLNIYLLCLQLHNSYYCDTFLKSIKSFFS